MSQSHLSGRNRTKKKGSNHVPEVAEETIRTGLQLPGISVQRISGPVSMIYLKPSTKKVKEYNEQGLFLPLLLLFGDRHRSTEEMCSPCEKEQGCYPIYDKTFLKELDKIAAKYPVDFYTESAEFADMDDPRNVLFHRFLQQTTWPCHERTRRSQSNYTAVCPTKRIRWHYTDVRFMVDKLEGVMLYPHYWEHFEVTTDKIESVLLDSLDASEARKGLGEVQSDYQSEMEETFSDPIAKEGHFARCATRHIVYSHMTAIEKVRLMVQLYMNKISEYQGTGKSAIAKQLAKINIPSLQSMEVWTRFFISHMTTDRDLLDKIEELSRALQPIPADTRTLLLETQQAIARRTALPDMEDDDVIRMARYIGPLKDTESIFYYIDGLINTYFVEMYTMLRMLKMPTEGVPPLLALAYHGAGHIDHLVKMLTDPLFGYKETYMDKGDGLRCIEIEPALPLYRDVKRHATLRFGKEEDHPQLELYRQQLLAEKQGRAQSRSLRGMEEKDSQEEMPYNTTPHNATPYNTTPYNATPYNATNTTIPNRAPHNGGKRTKGTKKTLRFRQRAIHCIRTKRKHK